MITVHLTQNENKRTCLLLNQHNYANEMPFHSEIKKKHDFNTEPTLKHNQRKLTCRLNTQILSYANGLDLLPTCDLFSTLAFSSRSPKLFFCEQQPFLR